MLAPLSQGYFTVNVLSDTVYADSPKCIMRIDFNNEANKLWLIKRKNELNSVTRVIIIFYVKFELLIEVRPVKF